MTEKPSSFEVASENAKKEDLYEEQDGLSPLMVGYSWVVRITTCCFEFVALVLLGRFVDDWWGCRPWGLVVGCCIGVWVFLVGLCDVVKRVEKHDSHSKDVR